jgi:Leucine-rich repeat (LRR) protein
LLAGLEELLLDYSGLTALPEGIGGLAGLKALLLYGNEDLTALPAGLCLLAGLEELSVGGCGLTVLPEGIGGLVGLRSLLLYGNQELTALPAGLGRLHNLEELNLRNSTPELAALQDLQERAGLPTLLAHLAAQGGESAAGKAD